MNNKLIWLFLGVMTVTGVTSGTYLYHSQLEKIQLLSTTLEQQKQKIAVLNDQLVVLQRNVNRVESTEPTILSSPANTQNSDLKEDYLKDYIELIYLNVQQQQFDSAVSNIQQLKQKLMSQPLISDALNTALIEALELDQANIHQYVKSRSEHILVLQTQLRQLEQTMRPIVLDQANEKWNFENWFKLSQSQDIPDLQNRDLMYRHLQLRILLAQQALMAGQLDFYYQQINDLKNQLQKYPDAQSKNILINLKKIQSLPLITLPQMTTLTLVRGV